MLAALLAAAALAAQAPQHAAPSPLRLIAHGDTVTVFLTEAPPRGGGFVVYRGPVGGALVKVTPVPVTAARDAAIAAGMIGPDLVPVERSVQALDALDLLRRLRLDPFAAVVLSAFYPRLGEALGRIYADTGLAPGARLAYRVVFTDDAGQETDHALTGAVVVADQPPPAPAALAADVADHLATLRWAYPAPGEGAAENVVGFIVYRADGRGEPFQRVTPVPVLRTDAGPLTYRDVAVTSGVAYRYQVAALDLAGREGPRSAPLEVTPVDRTPPAFPANVVARAEDGGVLVVWRVSPEPDAAGYVVERSEEVAGPFVRITTTPVPVDRPSLLDTTATGGHRYFYRVIASDRSGNASAPSALAQVVVVDRSPPAAPQGVTATPVAHRLTVRWRRSAAPDLMGYYVYRAVPGRTAARLTRLPVVDTVFVDSGYGTAGLRPGGQFVIGVSAVDSARNESPRTDAQVLVPDDEPPDPPSGLLARDIDGRFVEVAWSAPQAADVAGYDVRRAVGDSAFAPLVHVTGLPPFAVRDTGVVHGRRYAYQVVAVDSAGNRSVPAVDSLAFRRNTPPPAPRNLAVRATPEGVALIWERVADPELAGYRVYRSPLPTGTFEPLSDRLIVGTTATDTAPSPGIYYRVRAVDSSGNESAPSPAARAGTP